ncbi:SIR2 family NAD-dependent protein deacylase [Halanaerobium hydrogeniformans]|uniref:protein acetyllysine N-acetyltransferase n=1 Tax=Halanaerobium hydrogeniformans TaxID=656519 RepID=E4RKU9_HALHG|nr:NAD-dependent deacylase [Halanaerobium hydrogeniformans]ADQ15690.1 Silent information regulator protein Sir2 [Halanaerobium hydrogeniformans]
MNKYKAAADLIQKSKHITAFTGAGISVQSGIPDFRSKNGLWDNYEPEIFSINYLKQKPKKTWHAIKQIYYEFFNGSQPNLAHRVLAEMEKNNLLDSIITQNIDSLHQEAGSINVIEYHGNSKKTICLDCGAQFNDLKNLLSEIPPFCSDCGGILKPDFIFFGESVSQKAHELAYLEAKRADLFIIIGTTGDVYPAARIPFYAKDNGAKIIEINIKKSNYSDKITKIFLENKAVNAMEKLAFELSISLKS